MEGHERKAVMFLNNYYPQLYYLERAINDFCLTRFPVDSDDFFRDRARQDEFHASYDGMLAQISLISDAAFELRVAAEMSQGISSAAVRSHVLREQELMEGLVIDDE